MALDIEIELARSADAGKIAELSRDHVESGLRWSWKAGRVLGMIQSADAVVIVARSRFGLVGFAIMEFHDRHAHLNLLAVSPQVRRQGVASELLNWLHKSAATAGIGKIQLEIRAGNSGGLKFYEQFGYRVGAKVSGYYQGKEDALRMVCQLIDPETEAQRP